MRTPTGQGAPFGAAVGAGTTRSGGSSFTSLPTHRIVPLQATVAQGKQRSWNGELAFLL
ncbi:hypothetical protein M378DRAFT_171938, partial [Amanita muscaria Koide BX008]